MPIHPQSDISDDGSKSFLAKVKRTTKIKMHLLLDGCLNTFFCRQMDAVVVGPICTFIRQYLSSKLYNYFRNELYH